ncbi:hypothetical protein [Mariniblastus fucicola]|uniref:Uncharacterized protein n=1 Tax=Mariniblastus fucicola TaxID=980251 RepID=A0A5B9P7U5_9BACT|nr:hypothetical protein [Mariniblastus fucicola]QEG22727.1 hypothetical protein MFFC18_26100 [Mariniblastus fucicola]
MKRKIENFSKSVGLSPVKIVLSLLFLAIIGYFIFSVAFSGKENQVADYSPSASKLMQQELTIDQQLEEMLNKQIFRNQNFLVVIEQMSGLEDELSKIEENNELTKDQQLKVEQLRLRNKSVIVMVMVKNKVTCEAEQDDLYEYCKARVDSEDAKLRELARFWRCVIPTIQFRENPTEETFKTFSDVIQKYPDGFLDSPEHATTISRLVLNLSQGNPATLPLAKQGYRVLAAEMAESSLPEIQNMSEKLEELAVFGEFDLPSLQYRLTWSDPTGARDIEGALDRLAESPDSDLMTWILLIRSYESYLATDRIEQAGAAWRKVWDLSEQLSAKRKEAIQKALERQKIRAMSIGTKFDVSGPMLTNGVDDNPQSEDFTAILFCDKSKNSMSALVALRKQSGSKQLKYRPVLAFEKELGEKDLESLKHVPKEISVAARETALKYFEAFPADFFPYVILVDKEGTVVAANLAIEQITNRVATISADARRARAARALESGTPTLSQ